MSQDTPQLPKHTASTYPLSHSSSTMGTWEHTLTFHLHLLPLNPSKNSKSFLVVYFTMQFSGTVATCSYPFRLPFIKTNVDRACQRVIPYWCLLDKEPDLRITFSLDGFVQVSTTRALKEPEKWDYQNPGTLPFNLNLTQSMDYVYQKTNSSLQTVVEI